LGDGKRAMVAAGHEICQLVCLRDRPMPRQASQCDTLRATPANQSARHLSILRHNHANNHASATNQCVSVMRLCHAG
ncbi:hypothetical protein HAX54_026700, partial [Datura stramonium]|nr:hypothetical protein [Datura stramonium]